jgi:hypothetical protein
MNGVGVLGLLAVGLFALPTRPTACSATLRTCAASARRSLDAASGETKHLARRQAAGRTFSCLNRCRVILVRLANGSEDCLALNNHACALLVPATVPASD